MLLNNEVFLSLYASSTQPIGCTKPTAMSIKATEFRMAIVCNIAM